MIPAFQTLILFITEKDEPRTHLYATQLVPQLSVCQSSVYKRLKENLLGADGAIDFSRSKEYLQDLREAMRCFGFTCEDIGGTVDIGTSSMWDDFKCKETGAMRTTPLAGYLPSSDVEGVSNQHIVLQFN